MSWTRREDEKERSRNGGGNVEKRTYAQLAEGGRREDEGVEQDSAVISKREEACGCDVERPC